MLFNLNLSLFANTPVVDCELQPKAYLTRKDLSKPPEYFLKCNWYKSKEKVMVTCCVHHCKIATVQCIDCVKYELPVEKSYHCSNKCFIDNWKNHCVRHPAASVGDIKTNIADDQIGSWYCDGSWPSFNSCSAFESGSESSGTAAVGEREGESWIEIVSSVTYKPTSHDFGYRLKLESLAVDYEGVPLTLTEVIVTDPVIITPAPSLRRMIPVGSLGCFSNSGLETQPCLAGTFSILTYNVLADYYVNKSSYPYCSRWALTWQYRRQILLHEIIRYNADILCLQEVQRDHFENFFEPELAKLGYAVSYKKKILERYTGEYKSSTDGCATFFRRSRFREIGKWELEFQTMAISAYESLSQHQRTMEAVRLLKDNVALLVILEAVENGAVFCVANTHIHANPNAKDAKLWQVASLINHLESVYDSHIPILFCGDLNSLPGSAPHELVVMGIIAPHELVVMGRVGSDHEDLANSSVAMFKHVKLSHRMCLASAYSSMLENTNGVLISKEQRDKMDPKTQEPFFTNITSQFVGAIDYIFYSEGAFTVTRLLELLDRQSVRKDTALPSHYWPSDHIALMAEFYFEPLDTSWGES